uniref:Aminotransferase class I/classII large domain-containing protein n=1 Tax=Tetradesmus obliquus TaxID=3088 RepID=A0A383VSP6_TETOB
MEEAHGDSSKFVDWEQRWSREARRKQMPTLQSIVSKYQGAPGIIGMHGGLPPADAFPFSAFKCSLQSSSNDAAAAAAAAAAGSLSISDPPLVSAAQQYNMHAKGYPPLQSWARDIVCELHQPATLKPHPQNSSSSSNNTGTAQQQQQQQQLIGLDVAITPGASAALDAIARVLLNPGDAVLLEEFTYNHHAEAHLLPMGCELLPVPMDSAGLLPAALDAMLTQRSSAGLALPRLLYCIPTGQNPTGAVMGPERMRQVYELARKWDLIILEDDAYFWLQYPQGPEAVPGLNLRPGFLSIDVDGRVIRVDTLAKLLGPGFRLGWVAGPPALVNKVALYIAAISVGASSLSQVMIHQLLLQWGRPGLEAYVVQLQQRYARSAAAAEAAAAAHLADIAEWQPIRAGMFMWVKIKGEGVDASPLMELGAAEKVMVVTGNLSSVAHLQATAHAQQQQAQDQQQQPEQQGSHMQQQQQQQLDKAAGPCPYFRVSFASVASDADLQEGFARLRRAVLRCQALAANGAAQ